MADFTMPLFHCRVLQRSLRQVEQHTGHQHSELNADFSKLQITDHIHHIPRTTLQKTSNMPNMVPPPSRYSPKPQHTTSSLPNPNPAPTFTPSFTPRALIISPCTASSPLAQRRLNRRNNLPDPSATHAQHAETWQHYVKVHDAFFEECADEIREEFRMREGGEILAARPTRVVFGRVDYQQSASGRASGCDEPVSPKSSVPVALGSGGIRGDAEEEGDEYLERYYTLADVGPFDVEAQVGLPVHRDEVVSASLKRFREIIRGAMAGNLWK
ncbi:hypothetical protein LTR91_004503 [Friedmanniomyces endolithicus]|uniref:Uncharacterized protein n=1 Tax=Friedmanniomyces endolithicus TaxID=329885 RepID=A0AAN6KX76_9PEZI|nr:hypothetical protein LTR75_006745 [Friedmanniomyces endolithicus]KAK0811608.1 hypothetical protein LTR38_003532 [Friedmanniomyces endolithicus]KAK0845047.1 hypothetical protein LTR03_007729 [Friedmanniomyces endolithicus]KAK0916573.1 hypothetical protein LTR02_000705 [Friedmanniomyces endolithicus]KAK0999198.1 hypothetical protein LTS01_005492 [Friedmanniomyces endolithicus]